MSFKKLSSDSDKIGKEATTATLATAALATAVLDELLLFADICCNPTAAVKNSPICPSCARVIKSAGVLATANTVEDTTACPPITPPEKYLRGTVSCVFSSNSSLM